MGTLQTRMHKLNKKAGRQSSVFDGKQRMDENFVPLHGTPVLSLSKNSAVDFEHADLF